MNNGYVPRRRTQHTSAQENNSGWNAAGGTANQANYAQPRQGVPTASAYGRQGAYAEPYGQQANYGGASQRRQNAGNWQQPGGTNGYGTQKAAAPNTGYAGQPLQSNGAGYSSMRMAGGNVAYNGQNAQNGGMKYNAGNTSAGNGGYRRMQEPDGQRYGAKPLQNGTPSGQNGVMFTQPKQENRFDAGQNYYYGNGYVPKQQDGEHNKYRGGNNGGQPPRKNLRTVLVALAAAVLVVCLGVGGYAYQKDAQVKQAVAAYDDVFCPGVYVDGIHLGGMTAEEGVNAVTTKAQARNDSWYVNLTYQGQVVTTLNASQLGMKVDVMDALNNAWAQGHTGDAYQRQAAMEALMVNNYQGYSAEPGGDTSVVDNVLAEIKKRVDRAPNDAKLVEFNPENSYPFTFQDAEEGRVLDTDPLKARLYQMVSAMESGDVEIEPDSIAPSVTTDDLKQKLTLRGTMYTPISTHSNENRTNNIRRCFESISGYILEAGKKFSFNSVVGKRTLANGFYEAVEYAYGSEVMGVGGGSCQASTTLYQAAVTAGLEIITREPHSKEVSYAKYGEDATVYWEGNRKIDLVFRNNTDSPLYFVAAVQSDPSNRKRLIARVSIYGESLGDNVRYELQSVTVKELDPPEEPEYVKDTKQQYVTYTDQEYTVRKAAKGYVVESYRVKYEGDTVTERTLLYTDTYKARSKLIYVGTKKR